jgi:hypothetical protein
MHHLFFIKIKYQKFNAKWPFYLFIHAVTLKLAILETMGSTIKNIRKTHFSDKNFYPIFAQ